MNTLNKLADFLFQSGLEKEAAELLKIAAYTKEDLQEQFPNLFRFYRDDINPNMAAGIFKGINKLLEKDSNVLSDVQKFEELQGLLKGQKKQKIDKFFKSIIKEYGKDVPIEDLEAARVKGLGKEEILFLLKDRQNHSWQEKVDMAYQFNDNKARINGLGADASITKFENIDIAHSKIFANFGGDEYLREFYSEIRDEAIKTSDVVYNSKNYIVVATKSVKASQYWEQSVVTTDKDGEIHSGLCTARHSGNYFNSYYDPKEQLIFVIITKHTPTMLEIPYTKFSDKNYFWNLISMQVVLDEGTGNAEVIEGQGSTVNRNNDDVSKADIAIALGDEHQAIFEEIKKYIIDRWTVSKLDFNPKGENYKEKSALNLFKDLNESGVYSTSNQLKQLNNFISSKNLSDLLLDDAVKEATKELSDESLMNIFKYSEYDYGYVTSIPISQFFQFYEILKDKSLLQDELILKLEKADLNLFLEVFISEDNYNYKKLFLMLPEQKVIDIFLKKDAKEGYRASKELSQSQLKSCINIAKEKRDLYSNKKLFSYVLEACKKNFYSIVKPYKFFSRPHEYGDLSYFTDIFLNMFIKIEDDKLMLALKVSDDNIDSFNYIYKKFLSNHQNENDKKEVSNKLKNFFSKINLTDVNKFLEPKDDSDDIINESSYRCAGDFLSAIKDFNPNKIYDLASESIIKLDGIESVEAVEAFKHLFTILALKEKAPEKISEEEASGAAYSLGKKIRSKIGGFVDGSQDLGFRLYFLNEYNLKKYKNILIRSYFEKNILQDEAAYSITDLAIEVSKSNLKSRVGVFFGKEMDNSVYDLALELFKKRLSQGSGLDALSEEDETRFVQGARRTLRGGTGGISEEILKILFKDFNFFKKIVSQFDFGSFRSALISKRLVSELGKKYVYFLGVYLISNIQKVFTSAGKKELFLELAAAGLENKDIENLFYEDTADPVFLCSRRANLIAKDFKFQDSARFKEKVEKSLQEVSERSKDDFSIAKKLPSIVSRPELKDVITNNPDALKNIIETYKNYLLKNNSRSQLEIIKSIEKLGYIINESDLDNNNFVEMVKIYREGLAGLKFNIIFKDVFDIKDKSQFNIKNFANILGKDLFNKFRTDKDLIKTLISKSDYGKDGEFLSSTRIREYKDFMFDKSTVETCIYEMSKGRQRVIGKLLSYEEMDFIINNFSYGIIPFIENLSTSNLDRFLTAFDEEVVLKYYKMFEKHLKESVRRTSFKGFFGLSKTKFLINAPEDMQNEIINHIYYGNDDLKISDEQLVGLITGGYKIGTEEVNKIYLNEELLNKAVLSIDIQKIIKETHTLRELFHHYGIKLEDGSAEEKFEALNILSVLFEKMNPKDIENNNLSYLYNKMKKKSNVDLDMISYLKSRVSDPVINNKDKHYIQKFISEGLHKNDQYELITSWITKNTDMLKITSDEFEEEVTSEIPVGEKIESLQVQSPEDDSKEILRNRIKDNLLKTLSEYDKIAKLIVPELSLTLDKTSKLHYINFLIFVYLYDRKILDSDIVLNQKGDKYEVKAAEFFSKASDYFDSFDNIEKFIDYLISYSEEIAGAISVDEELLPQNLDLSVSQPETKEISEEILEKNSSKKRYDQIKNIFSKVGK